MLLSVWLVGCGQSPEAQAPDAAKPTEAPVQELPVGVDPR
jgi:hypothetical protein